MPKVIFLIFLSLFLTFASAQDNFSYIKNFNNELINNGKILSITQDKRGVMYFAGDVGIVSYDGSEFDTITTTKASTLAVNDSGKVYAGLINSFGEIETKPNAKEEFKIFSKELEDKKFGEVYKIIPFKNQIYVLFSRRLVVLNSQSRKIEQSFPKKNKDSNDKDYIDYIFKHNEIIYANFSKKGLHKIEKGELVKINYKSALYIKMAISIDKSTSIVCDINNEIYKMQGSTIFPFETQVSHEFKNYFISDGVKVNKEMFLFCTNTGAYGIHTEDGDEVIRFDPTTKFPSSDFFASFIDKENGLWFAHSMGVSRVNIEPPFLFTGNISALRGKINSVIHNNNFIYVSTDKGLFYMKNNSDLVFASPKNISKCNNLLTMNEHVLVASREGLFILENGNNLRVLIPEKNIESIHRVYSDDTKAIINYGNAIGFYDLTKSKKENSNKFFERNNSINSVVEEKMGELWLGTDSGLVKLKFDENYQKLLGSEFIKEFSGKKVIVKKMNDRLFVFTDTKDVHIYDSKSQKFKSDVVLKNKYKDKAIFYETYPKTFINHKSIIYELTIKDDNSILTPVFNSYSFNAPIQYIFSENEEEILISTKEGYYILDYPRFKEKGKNKSFQTIIKEVKVNNKPINFLDPSFYTKLEYNKFNYEFIFTSTSFETEKANQFSYFLEGYDEKWSDWDFKTLASYPNLSPGSYVFHVKSKNVYGAVSEEKSYEFNVSPPWYSSTWAFIFYILIFILVIYVVVNAYTRRLRNQKLKLEEIVEERTKEISRANDELLSKNEEIKANADLLLTMNKDLESSVETIKNQQDKLIQSEKMAVLGQLVANIAHELNTPLGAIKNSISNMLESIPDAFSSLPTLLSDFEFEDEKTFFSYVNASIKFDKTLSTKEERDLAFDIEDKLIANKISNPEEISHKLVSVGLIENLEGLIELLKKYPKNCKLIIELIYKLGKMGSNLRVINLATDKTRKQVTALKSYVHKDHEKEFKPVNLIDSLETVLTIYTDQFKHGIEMTRNFSPKPIINGSAESLLQVWTNLIFNAIQAMNGKGKIEIDIQPKDNFYEIKVTDNGPGVPIELQDKIFQELFTTKPVGVGSGLGLSICKKIIESHGGTLTLDSVPGKTSFIVKLPIVHID